MKNMQNHHLTTEARRLWKHVLLPCLLLTLGISDIYSRPVAQHAPSSGSKGSLLWEVSGNGLAAPSYLYGTMHATDKRIFQVASVVMDKFDACEAFAAELSLDSLNMAEAAQMLKTDPDFSLREQLSKKQYRKLETVVKDELGVDVALLDQFKPIYLMTMLQHDDLMTGEMGFFLDQQFYETAVAQGKTVLGIETVAEQIEALSSLTMDQQVDMLMGMVKEMNTQREKTAQRNQALLESYLSGNLSNLESMVEAEGSMPEHLKDALIGKRNQVMAERIANLIREQATFVAIGAAHLPGNDGVVQLLENRGFVLQPIPFEFDGSGYDRLTATANNASTQTVSDANSTRKTGSGWIEYRFEEAGFRIEFPDEPQINRQKTEEGVEIHLASSANQATASTFAAGYVNQATDLDSMANKVADQYLQQLNGSITERRDTQFRDHPAREFTLSIMSMMEIRILVFNRNQMTYILMMGGLSGQVDTDKQKRFMDSLSFL